MSNPLPLDAAARDELARKAEAARTCWLGGSPEHDVEWLKTWLPDEFAEFFVACTPDVVLALLASVRGAEAELERDYRELTGCTHALHEACGKCTCFGCGQRVVMTQEGIPLPVAVAFDALDAARAHPPIQETDADA